MPDETTTLSAEEQKSLQSPKPILETMEDEKLGKWIRGRWDRLNNQEEERACELKANLYRWLGYPFIQPHPTQRNRLFLPPTRKNPQPKGDNQIERGVDRYVAQVTADAPVLEAIPGPGGEDEDDDATEGATHAIRGEWQRLKNNAQLKKLMLSAAIFRSAFKHYYIEPGPKRRATKKRRGKAGAIEEYPVDRDGAEVDDESLAAEVGDDQLANEVLSAFQVRWTDGYNYAHDAPEVMVGRLPTLREVYQLHPEARKIKLSELLTDTPRDADEYLRDLSGKSGATAYKPTTTAHAEPEEGQTGEGLEREDGESPFLDRKVFHLLYYRRKDELYPKGYRCVIVGKVAVDRGDLDAFGDIIPVAHYKILHSPIEKYGRSIVDVLRAAQDQLDFLDGHIMRWLQSLRDRYFVHTNTDVNAVDLNQPHDTIIPWSGAVAPTRVGAPTMPNAIAEWHDRKQRSFDDKLGIHESGRGLHVPGVQSGQHVAQLRVGDETILSLTRDEITIGVEQEGRIILHAVRKLWSFKRQVRYFGPDKEYVARALAAADISGTADVQLVQGSLLMITPAQRSQIMSELVQTKLLQPEDVRKSLPTADIGGFSLAEDPHYMRARRQGARFLDGPPAELVETLELLDTRMAALTEATQQLAGDPLLLEPAVQMLEGLRAQREDLIAQFDFEHHPYEEAPDIARVHFREHARALSRARVERFPEFWIQLFERHTVLEGQLAGMLPAAQPAAAQQPPAAGAPAQQPGAAPEAPAAQLQAVG